MTVIGLSGALLLLVLVPAVVVAYGLVDAARRPDEAWRGAGENKTLWIAIQAVGLMFSVLGMVLTLVYATVIRPRVAAASRAGVPLEAGRQP